MKKKIMILSVVSTITVTAAVLPKMTSLADSAKKSSGNFTLQDESEMAIYQEDFSYLQNELEDLFQELPKRTNDISEELEVE